MLDIYIRTVEAYYFPPLLAAGIAFLLFAAIAPFLDTKENRPRPLPLAGTIMFALVFWPIVLPLSFMVLAFGAFLVVAAGAQKFADRVSQSAGYKRLLSRIHNQKI